MNSALSQLFVLCKNLPNKSKAGIVSRLLVEHTKVFNKKVRFNLFKKRLKLLKKDEILLELKSYYALHSEETNSLFAEIIVKIVMYENIALIQDFIVALREQDWTPDLSQATVVGKI